MSHVTGPAGGPFREDREPCRECTRREAAEAQRKAASLEPREQLWLVIALFVGGFLSFLGAVIYHADFGDKSKECYFVKQHHDFTGHIYRTVERGFGKPDARDLREFPSVDAAKAFLVEQKAKMCP